MALFTKEKFDAMIKDMDKDGDGTVTKVEFGAVYKKAMGKLDMPEEEYDALWKKIDADGDGELTVTELSKFFGVDGENTNDMSDEQILQALQMQMQLESEKPVENKVEEAKVEEAKAGRDETIKVVLIEKKKKDATPEEKLCIEFLEMCQMGELVKPADSEDNSVSKMLEARKVGDAPPTFTLRCEDEKSEMAPHKLARTKVKGKDETGPGIKEQDFQRIVVSIFNEMREEAKAKGKTLYEDINHQDKAGKTALYLAIEYKNLKMIELLFDLGKDGPDSLKTNNVGWTAMHCAVHTDDLVLLKMLISRLTAGRIKALLKTADKTGREPLHIAAYKCSEEMVTFLIEKGATTQKADSGGNTAIKLAERSGRRKSREIMVQASELMDKDTKKDTKPPAAKAPAAAPP